MSDTIVPVSNESDEPCERGSRIATLVMKQLLRRIRHGTIDIDDATTSWRVGEGEPLVRVRVLDERCYQEILRTGSVGLGASYMKGWWECDDLTSLIRILITNIASIARRRDDLARTFAPLTRPLAGPLRRYAARSKDQDRTNVRAHYDLGNEFFELMLDETMMYSCAYFDDLSSSLAHASRAKLDRLCRKLSLTANDHVVEIGTGWGGFALHAATHYGARVTTTTISDAQFDYASRRVADAGLSDRVSVLNRDYRDLGGTYDKLVSIEMIEAIGWRELDTFFATCASLVRPEGVVALQAIVIDDRSYERAKTHDDFIKHYIFPGGFLPSIEAMVRAMTASSDLRVINLEDIGAHYVETLRRWRDNLRVNADALDELHLGEPFTRMWQMYLSYCEAAFIERHVSNVQLVLARANWRDPLTLSTSSR